MGTRGPRTTRCCFALISALFYDLSSDKKVKIPSQGERRERELRELIRKGKKPVALFVDEAHDLHSSTLTGLKRIIEVVEDGGGILSVVLAKFMLALAFQWFISRKFGASKTSIGKQDSKQRKQQIEEWSDDIYRPPPRLADPAAGPDRSSKRGSTFLPQTSRFTSPYTMDKSVKTRAPPTTMTSQSTSSRGGMYRQLNLV